VTKAVPGIKAFGAITLKSRVGGLNPVAVELAGSLACKIVWFPTVDAENENPRTLDLDREARVLGKIQRELEAEGISPPKLTLIDGFRHRHRAREALHGAQSRGNNMILAHRPLGRKEIFAIVKEAKEMGLKKSPRTHAEVPVAESDGRRTEGARRRGRAHRALASRRPYTNKAPWETAFAKHPQERGRERR